MQAMLNLGEDEAVGLLFVRISCPPLAYTTQGYSLQITKFTISCDGRIIVTPPLQALTKYGGDVRSCVYGSLFPSNVCD